MRVCEHFSQRATCPPSAAVRQFSIADIIFNCSRLTWPALACRQAGPWARKISATSSVGRDTRAVLLGGRFGLPELQSDMLQRAHYLADGLGSDARIERRVIKLGVTKQHLDDANVGVLLEQMSGEAVP